MSAEAPTSTQLRRLGAVVILLIIGIGYVVSWIPDWLRPESETWAVTVPVRDGAGGLEVGSRVLVGGMPRGRVVDVGDIRTKQGPPRSREMIIVEFELDEEVVLARNAVIRQGTSTAGNIGFLDIKYVGGPGQTFKPGEDRIIPISRTTSRGGPAAGFIGRTNGEMLERITAGLEKLTTDIEEQDRIIQSNLRPTRMMIDELNLDLDRNTTEVTARIREVVARYQLIFEQVPLIRQAAFDLRKRMDAEAAAVRVDLERWRARFALIDLELDAGREDVEIMRRFTDRIRNRLEAVALDLQSAMTDAESVATRTRNLAPEISAGLNRTTARMVLAGGQLKAALEDLVPLVIEALTTRPDRASESRRRLLESTNDVVLAGMELRDAARFLEEASRRGRAGHRRDSAPAPNLDESLILLEETMNRLAERLRQEIEAELRLDP